MNNIFASRSRLPLSQQAETITAPLDLQQANGTASNVSNPPTRNDIGIPVVTIFLFLVVVTGSLRLYGRVFVVRGFKIEDYLGFASYIPFFGLSAIFILIMDKIGFIVDEWNLAPATVSEWSMYLWIWRLVYALIMIFAKTAILLEWINLFVPKATRPWFFWAATIMIVVNVIAYTAAIILTCVRCKPIYKIWQPWVNGTCADQKSTDVASSFINLALDVVILLLPQPLIWRLTMSRPRRIGVTLVFSIGLFVVVCAIGRIHSNLHLDYGGNITRDGSVNLIWSYGEATFVMMVFAIPGIPKAFASQPWLRRVVSAIRSWARPSDSTGQDRQESRPRVQTIGSRGRLREPTRSELDLMETQNTDDLDEGYKSARLEKQETSNIENGTWKTALSEIR